MNKIYIDIREESDMIKRYFNKDLVSVDELLDVIEDLHLEIERVKEKYDDLARETTEDPYDRYMDNKLMEE